jgi:hypothetical protein
MLNALPYRCTVQRTGLRILFLYFSAQWINLQMARHAFLVRPLVMHPPIFLPVMGAGAKDATRPTYMSERATLFTRHIMGGVLSIKNAFDVGQSTCFVRF